MGGLSFWHIATAAVVLVVFFAHSRIPSAFGALGLAIGRLRHALTGNRRHRDDNVIEGRYERLDE
jgi:Sec-independent protein translocase protein TatA